MGFLSSTRTGDLIFYFQHAKCQVTNNVVINKFLYNFSTLETKKLQRFKWFCLYKVLNFIL
jgi:hypothetical protein